MPSHASVRRIVEGFKIWPTPPKKHLALSIVVIWWSSWCGAVCGGVMWCCALLCLTLWWCCDAVSDGVWLCDPLRLTLRVSLCVVLWVMVWCDAVVNVHTHSNAWSTNSLTISPLLTTLTHPSTLRSSSTIPVPPVCYIPLKGYDNHKGMADLLQNLVFDSGQNGRIYRVSRGWQNA